MLLDPAAADEAAEERLDVEAPRKSTSPAADATRPKKCVEISLEIPALFPASVTKNVYVNP